MRGTVEGYPIIDKKAALERQEGDLEFLKELWKVFVEDALSKKEKLQSAIRGNDLVSLERFSHSLKSGAATIGAKRVREIAQQLEGLAKNEQIGALPAAHDKLQQELDLAIQAIQQELGGSR